MSSTGFCKYCGERAPFVLIWPDAEEVCETHYHWRLAYMKLAAQARDTMNIRADLVLRPVSLLPQPRHASLAALLPTLVPSAEGD